MQNLKTNKVEKMSTKETREIEGGRILPIGPPILLPVLKKLWDWATS